VSTLDAATVDRWLSELGVDVLERAERDGISSWDLQVDGRRRPDIRLTLILDPASALLLWVHFAPPLNDSFRVSYRQFLRWNDELPFVKFALAEDDRPMLAMELDVQDADLDRLGSALVRLLAVCDLTYERALPWLLPGARAVPVMGRESRQAALFERYDDRLEELAVGVEPDAGADAPDTPT
jgi:Putative bacterial sensory transduction regulator